jgi:hypothetical protein
MVVKLANVLCLTIFTKDNCVFRHQSRQRIDVIRTGVQARVASPLKSVADALAARPHEHFPGPADRSVTLHRSLLGALDQRCTPRGLTRA